eukprot:TRINITY_DN4383_c0_g1_i1.p1 TRINITY_DN4383_c0_g1~~TRINITY_DN4383_c0_g1_i1.p1  ORF type:complete len:429 (-),score=133.68 TRINITY_DN4383_c0_g1_i1:109-1395(-)
MLICLVLQIILLQMFQLPLKSIFWVQIFKKKILFFSKGEFNLDNSEIKMNFSPQSMENIQDASANSKKRGRPKKVAKPNESTDVSRVQVDEADLIQFTSKTYEDWVSKLEKERPFTFAEEQVMKLQRRRIKNRESAHNSREKKRIASCQLTLQISHLQKENQDLKKQLDYYKNENRSLAEQLSKFLGTKIQASPIRKGVSKPKGVVAGTVLLAVFLCFGIFFGGLPVQQPSPSSSHSTSRVLFELGNVQNTSNFQCPVVSCPSSPLPLKSNSPLPSSAVVPHQGKTERQLLQEWEESNKTGKVVQVVEIVGGEFTNGSDAKTSELTHKKIPTFKPFVNWDVMKNPPNTHHFIVSGIEQIFPPNTSDNVKDEPYKMNFIVSSKSLPNASPTDDRVVQIFTQVIDISFLSEGVASPVEASQQSASQVIIH